VLKFCLNIFEIKLFLFFKNILMSIFRRKNA
jgi:hypothetical protein